MQGLHTSQLVHWRGLSWRCVLAVMACQVYVFADEPPAAPPAPVAESTPSPTPDGTAAEDLPQVLDLSAALRYALRNNPSLATAAQQVEIAQTLVKQARSLYMPQIDASYTAGKTWLPDSYVDFLEDLAEESGSSRRTRHSEDFSELSSPLVDILTQLGLLSNFDSLLNTFQSAIRAQDDVSDILKKLGVDDEIEISDSFESYTLGLQAGFIIFDGFSRKFMNAMARFGKEESEAGYHEGRRLLALAVARAYYGTQLARENMQIAQADEKFNLRMLDEAKKRREGGKGATSDVLNFEVRLRAAKASLLMSQSDYETARIGLSLAMGLAGAKLPEAVDVSPLAPEDAVDFAPVDADGEVAYALDHRPSLEQGEYTVKRAGALVKERYSTFYPKVLLGAKHEAQTYNNSSFGSDDFSTSVGVNVTYNVFAGGRQMARISEAKHTRTLAERRLEAEEQSVAGDVRAAVVKLKKSQEQLILQRDAAAFVGKNRDMAEKAYDVGKGSLALLNQTQRDLVQAQVMLALAQVSLKQAQFELEAATGRVLEELPSGEVAEPKPEGK